MIKLLAALWFLFSVPVIIPMAIIVGIAIPVIAFMEALLKGAEIHMLGIAWAVETMMGKTKLSLFKYFEEEIE